MKSISLFIARHATHISSLSRAVDRCLHRRLDVLLDRDIELGGDRLEDRETAIPKPDFPPHLTAVGGKVLRFIGK